MGLYNVVYDYTELIVVKSVAELFPMLITLFHLDEFPLTVLQPPPFLFQEC